ncbi:right-handed parallel beta-helix repeat-containing protein [Terrarubrum flagellatum]|uniref:right-handed parallel beta-helix repeat-containing protein n=1 Tax=Terrirubrum flagellatum TaxID=2895980 RepID=UPI0031451A36
MQAAVEAIFDDFQAFYLGRFASDPATDPNGNPLQEGAIYFNTTTHTPRYYDGSAWQTFPYATVADGAITFTKLAPTVLKKMRERRSLADFNAPMDGVTDDFAATQAAINAINAAGGGVLVFPGGYTTRYKKPAGTFAALDWKDNVFIEIEGGHTVLHESVFGGFNSGWLTKIGGANVGIKGEGLIQAAPPVTLNGNLTSGSNVVSGLASTSALSVNMPVHHANIPTGASIATIAANSVTLQLGSGTPANATASPSGAPIDFCFTGGPFITVHGTDGFEMGGGLVLGDIYGALIGFCHRALLSPKNFEVKGVRCGYFRRAAAGAGLSFYAEDGLHFLAPAYRGVIDGVFGISGDDLVILSIENFGQPNWDSETAEINISNIIGESLWAQGFRLHRAAASTTGAIRRITGSNINVTGNSLGGNAGSSAVKIEDLTGGQGINSVKLSDVIGVSNNAGEHGIDIVSATDVTLTGPESISAAKVQIRIKDSARVTIVDPKIATPNRTASMPGIQADNSNETKVIGGNVGGQLGHGVDFLNSSGGQIIGVNSKSNGGDGIAFRGSSANNQVIGGDARSNSGDAVKEYDTANHNYVSGLEVGTAAITMIGGSSIATKNPGRDPKSADGLTPSGSPWAYTAGADWENIFVGGGTVSDIKVDGRTVAGSTNLMARLAPHQQLVVTYSSPPSVSRSYG